MTLATFTGRSRSVRAISQRKCAINQRVGYGLQIRIHQFESDTCLQYLAGLAKVSLNKLLNIPVTVLFRSGRIRTAPTGGKVA